MMNLADMAILFMAAAFVVAMMPPRRPKCWRT